MASASRHFFMLEEACCGCRVSTQMLHACKSACMQRLRSLHSTRFASKGIKSVGTSAQSMSCCTEKANPGLGGGGGAQLEIRLAVQHQHHHPDNQSTRRRILLSLKCPGLWGCFIFEMSDVCCGRKQWELGAVRLPPLISRSRPPETCGGLSSDMRAALHQERNTHQFGG